MQNPELYSRVEVLKIARDILVTNRHRTPGDDKPVKPIRAQQVRQLAETMWGFAMPEGAELDCGCGKGEPHAKPAEVKIVTLPFSWARLNEAGPHKKLVLMVGTMKFATITVDGEVSCTLQLNLPGHTPQVVVGPAGKAMSMAVGKLHEWTAHHPATVDEIVAALEKAAHGD